MAFRTDEGMWAVAPGMRVDRRGGAVVVTLTGEHDLASREALCDAVEGALAERLPVVVDLSEADFVDSVVVGVLIDTHKAARKLGIHLGIVLSEAPENDVRRLFELSTLTSVFAVYATPDDAIDGVQVG